MQVNPADVFSRAGGIPYSAEPSEYGASLDEPLPICDFSAGALKKTTAFTVRALYICAMGACDPKAWKLGLAEFRRGALMRASLVESRKESDVELKLLGRPPQATGSAGAFDLIGAIAIEALPATPAMVHDWGHANAICWLWAFESHGGACGYNEEKLLAAATMRAAESGVSRGYPIHSMGEHIFKMLIAANDPVAGYW